MMNGSVYARNMLLLRFLNHEKTKKTFGENTLIIKSRPKVSSIPCPENFNPDHCNRLYITLTEEGCKKFSQLPYNESDGSDKEHKPCKTNSDCPTDLDGFTQVCQSSDDDKSGGSKCMSSYTYYEYDDVSNSCNHGNYILKKWCEVPKSRNTKPILWNNKCSPIYL